MIKRIILFFTLALLLSSCVSRKKIVYFQNISSLSSGETINYEPRLKSDDLLMIIVSAPDPEAAAPFNLQAVGVVGVNNINNLPLDTAGTQAQFQSYLVDNKGYIQFPVLGALKLGGLTREEAMAKLQTELKKYINNPIVNMRIVNFKVSVIGEVLTPKTINVTTERITLLEALSISGDLTIYGDRSNVLIIREVDGKKTHNFIDITKADFINSPFYYLSQNDVIYVEPNKTRINSSAVGPNTAVIISAVSVFITLIALLIR